MIAKLKYLIRGIFTALLLSAFVAGVTGCGPVHSYWGVHQDYYSDGYDGGHHHKHKKPKPPKHHHHHHHDHDDD